MRHSASFKPTTAYITQRSSHAVNQTWRNFPMPRMVKNRDKRARPIDPHKPFTKSFVPFAHFAPCRYVNNFGKLDNVIDGPFSVSLIFHSKANFAYRHLVCPSIVCTCLSLFEISYGPIVNRKKELSKTNPKNPKQLGLVQPLTQF